MAIAFDAASNNGDSGGAGLTATLSHTCTGSNLILFVAVDNFGGDNVTGVTYNSVAMTQIGKYTYNPGDPGSEDTVYLYYLLAPATGAHNIVATRSGTSSNMVCCGASFTGVKQSGQPDASTTNGSTTNVSTLATSLSSVADNCWFVIAGGAGNTITASTNVTSRATATQTLLGSFGPQTPAGSLTMTLTPNSTTVGAVMASFSPVVTANGNFLLFM